MNFSKNTLEKRGKELSFLLRHDTSYNFDKNGWRTVDDLITNHEFSKELLDAIVETNSKKRYEYNEDCSKIRARQGHSVSVDVELKETTPPDVLYHGTASRFLDSIQKKGIIKGDRLYVHLSETSAVAKDVGKRHGSPVVLTIDAKQMACDNLKFYLSNNNVWLTDYVDPKYITMIEYA